MPADETFAARALVDGKAKGELLVLEAPLSFWGGLDPVTGLIIDRRHPQSGVCVSNHVLAMPGGRGSSSSSTVLAEAIRLGTAPAAIILFEEDPIVVLGAVVAELLYGRVVPVVSMPVTREVFHDGRSVSIEGSVVRISVDVIRDDSREGTAHRSG